MAATVQGAYFFRNRVRSIPMYIGMSNDFYLPTKSHRVRQALLARPPPLLWQEHARVPAASKTSKE